MADSQRSRKSIHAPDPERVAEAEVREQLGIELLAEHEELIDSQTFNSMHEALAIPRAGAGEEIELPAGAPGDGEELDELLLEEVATELPSDRGVGDALRDGAAHVPPPATPAAVATLEARILGASNRDDVARLALRLARRHARVVALLVVNRGIIMGIRGEGEGLEERIEGVMISSQMDGIFATAANRARSVRAHAPYGGMDARVLGALGRRDAQEAVAVPVVIRDRVVNLLYADNGPDSMPVTSMAALQALAACVAKAYERLIMERKRADA